jgi:aspartate/glutamate racemase
MISEKEMNKLKKIRLKSFSVETTTIYGKLIYLTKARCGRDALKNLITNSCDFNQIMTNKESNNMTIKIEHLKTR